MGKATASAPILKPNELEAIASKKQMAEVEKDLARMRQQEDEQKKLQEAFMSREIRLDAHERINSAIRGAAEQGKNELLALQFPSTWLNDGGRAINNGEPDWPNSLEGFAKRAYDYYSGNLQPLGYKLRAQIVNFPGGKPGDVGLYLSW